jgi:transcriptional regulator with XRE-family HTH domain
MRRLREAKGLSRRNLADALRINVTSLGGWEGGVRLPRDGIRKRLARLLDTNIETLFAGTQGYEPAPFSAAAFDTIGELPDLLMQHTRSAHKLVRALRLSAPYITPAHVQTEWRSLISERILDGTLEVQRIEVFYDLRRLQEVLSNIIRYDGKRYFVKSHCTGIKEVIPAFGTYIFDNDEFLLGAYWTGVPPSNKPSLRLSGTPFQIFFNAYWEEIWRRGTYLNIQGDHDLSAVQELAFKLGLPHNGWEQFVEEARTLEIGDGAPPLV